MFEWLGNITHKISAVIAGGLMLFGAGTATHQTQIASSTNSPSASSTSEIEQLRLELQQEKNARLQLQQEINGTHETTPSQPSQNNTSNSNLITPSGAVVNSDGQLISAPPEASTPAVTAGNGVLSSKQIAILLSPSVALISTPEGAGTGFVVNSGKYLVTNAHVVGNNSSVTVSLPNAVTFSAPVLGKDAGVDLAVIYVGDHKPPAVTLGSSDPSALSVGDNVFALGYPLSLAPYGLTNLTLTKGILSSRNTPSGSSIELLQTDASINPGNSGGPLVNEEGQVIGVNKSKFEGTDVQGIAFAIPIDLVKAWIPQLSQFGQSRYELYPIGSTYSIKRSLVIKIGFNEGVPCTGLGLFSQSDLQTCDLYKNYQNDYRWKIIEDTGN